MAEDDTKELQSLVLVLARAIKLFSLPYVEKKHFKLRDTALDLALDKLSYEQRVQYLRTHGLWSRKPRSLETLMSFLESRIAMHQKTTINKSGLLVDPKTQADDASAQSKQQNWCVYCKQAGHTVTACPAIESTMCFKCFQMGHTQKRCPNDPFLDNRL